MTVTAPFRRLSLLAAIILAVTAGCAQQPVSRDPAIPLPTAASVDLDRYLGRWYEIARLPNGFEKDCEGVTADYAWRGDGLIEVVNTCRVGSTDGPVKTAIGRARIVDRESNARLEVSFFGPFWGDYWILHLAEDYSVSLVGEPSGRFLWILARTPKISDAARTAALNRLREYGYDVSRLYFPAQPPASESTAPTR
jgi:apolipoprotein D and lipocalin family protein